MNITIYQAECGDAAKLSFCGNDGKYHHIFIDSGYERTFKNIIKQEIKTLIEKEEVIDCWIITHIHDDHIGGVKKYIDYINTGELKDIVKYWVYNTPKYDIIKQTNKISSPKSIRQSDILYSYLQSINNLPLNDFTKYTKNIDIFGLKIIFLSPTEKKLKNLRDKYHNNTASFENIEDETISIPTSLLKNDYDDKLLDFNLDIYNEDNNIENGSSISFIITYNGKNFLWLSDSHCSDIINSLLEIGYNISNKLNCEWVKISHHGSKRNNNKELFNLINCKNYIFTANGENIHNLPHKEVIAKILRNNHRDFHNKYRILFNYDNDILRGIFNCETSDIYKELNFETHFNAHFKLEL
jgi:hypothetical protein